MSAPLIVANWKMNVSTRDAILFAKKIALYTNKHTVPATLVICPSADALSSVKISVKTGKRIFLGAQNCAAVLEGAFTGEISARSLADIGCTYCIVGHSERRAKFGETDDCVAEKLNACLSQSRMKPILCIGETTAEKKEGATQKVLARQIASALKSVAPKDRSRIVIAYEPVWAIGSGGALTSSIAGEVIDCIRKEVKKFTPDSLKVLYGGSVTQENITSFLSVTDGVLVGTVSQKPQSFLAFIDAVRMSSHL